MSEVTAILPQAVGYGVVLGVGFFFAGFMAILAQIQNRYTQYSTKTSEEFNTASRSVKPGLIASGIVSAWTWAATLLQSCTVAYEYGISGPFWYASGATVQILLFAILGVKVKQNAPRCHTYLEIIYTRYGSAAHWVFMVFAFITNILVGSQLLLGGSAVVTALTGMNVYAAVWLIPVGVTVYVILGGLRATFLCDYTHTFILMIIMLYFIFEVYAISPLIGSPSQIASQISAGLTAPTAAVALLGKSGAAALLIILFMAVTSATSSEMIATSSILTFDVYKTHFRPNASPHAMITVSHIMIVVFAFVVAAVASIWQAIGIDLGWLYLFMGVVIGGPVVPVANTICWKKQSRLAAVTGAIVGSCSGIFAWLLTAALTNGGVLSIATTGQEYAALAGSLASICVGAICTVGISLWKPDDFDWEITRAINPAPIQSSASSTSGEAERERQLKEKERTNVEVRDVDAGRADAAPLPGVTFAEDEHPDRLKNALKFAVISSFALVAIMDIVVPLPMFFSHYTFSVRFFTAWVVISIIWAFCSAFICIFVPLLESSDALLEVGGRLVRDIFTGGRLHEKYKTTAQPSSEGIP